MKFFQKLAGSAQSADKFFQKAGNQTNKFFNKQVPGAINKTLGDATGVVNAGISDVNGVVKQATKGINQAGNAVNGVARQGGKVLGALGAGLEASTVLAPELAPLTMGLGAGLSAGGNALSKVQKSAQQVASLQAPKIQSVSAPAVQFA